MGRADMWAVFEGVRAAPTAQDIGKAAVPACFWGGRLARAGMQAVFEGFRVAPMA